MGALGRPRLGDRRRDHVLVVRLRSDEMADVRSAARATRSGMAPFVRRSALEAARSLAAGGAPPTEPVTAAAAAAEHRAAVRAELRRIGSNVNQAVRSLHRTGSAPAGLRDQLAELQTLIVDQVIDR